MRTLVFCIFSAAVLIFPFSRQALSEDNKTANNNTSRLVLTFYYPWYGIPEGKGGNGRVVHWGKIDSTNKDISDSTDYPIIGAYDSYDPNVLDQHCKWAKKAGIDCFIVSWWGQDTYEDKAMPLILQACEKSGLKACIYYETAQETTDLTAKDVIKVLEKYAAHPAYLKVNEKPVVFIYGRAIGQLGLSEWQKVIEVVQENYKPSVTTIGDQLSGESANVFDGIHTYNTAGILKDKTPEWVDLWAKKRYPDGVNIARAADKISTITVIPGYDDKKIRKPGLKVDRFDGKLYQLQWENAISANPDWILITSFNEWHEGSEIEPSLQYGEKYINLTNRFSKIFKDAKTIDVSK